ncbi:MAG: XRE family transcriptional regulator [Caldicoprobacterales bacterium]|jgi:transcriptional regulator with XRE-family HTH domain|nr:cupin domain-containing protein [Clostridiales bacterium]
MNIGEKIKHLRVKNGLTQQELANRCELSKGFISQVERDLTSPSIATLMDILECLGTNLKDFFNDKDDEKIIFHKDDVFIQEDKDLGHTIKWIVPNSQKNSMEPILMQIQPGGASEPDDPHDGEEFGYVMSGTIILHLGNQKFKVKKGESFYFRPSLVHFISNESKYSATVLWVSSPPSF